MKKLYSKEKFKTFQEWSNARVFGGSSASALLGLNPHMNKMDIYLSVIFPKERDDKTGQTASTIYGRECESYISNIVKLNFSPRYKVTPTKGFEMYRRKDKPYMTATLDGIIIDVYEVEGVEVVDKYVLEIKTHIVQSQADYNEWKSGNIPMNYLIQCIHYLAVMNDFKGCWLVAKLLWLDYDTGLPRTAKHGSGEEILYYKIERKDYEKDIAYLEQVETDFQEQHIVPRIPPDIDLPILGKEEDNGERTEVESV